MFIFRMLWALLSVGIRLVVVASPFIYFSEHNGTLPSFAVPTGIPAAVMLPVYSIIAFALLFWRGIADGAAQQQTFLAQLSDEEREAYFRRIEEQEEEVKVQREDDDRLFKLLDDDSNRWIPGTLEYEAHQTGDSNH